jgi:hypothetical protein
MTGVPCQELHASIAATTTAADTAGTDSEALGGLPHDAALHSLTISDVTAAAAASDYTAGELLCWAAEFVILCCASSCLLGWC